MSESEPYKVNRGRHLGFIYRIYLRHLIYTKSDHANVIDHKVSLCMGKRKVEAVS